MRLEPDLEYVVEGCLRLGVEVYGGVLSKLARADVLVLDDWAMSAITDVERRDLLEIPDERVARGEVYSTT